MSPPILSSARQKDLSPVLDHAVHYVASNQASTSAALVPKDESFTSDDICAVDALCSGIKNIGHSPDNSAVVSKCRISSASQSTTLVVKGVSTSRCHSAVPEKPAHGEINKTNEIARKQIAECSMCGDIGLRKHLFRCGKCQYRFQHTYCSNWYPKKRSYAGICNWCDISEDEKRRKQAKQTEGQTKLQTAVGLDNSKTKHRKVHYKTHKSDSRSRARNPWKNELEMLLDAATVMGEAGVESRTGNEIGSQTELRRSSSLPQTDQPSDDAKVDEEITGLNFKEPSSLAKKIGRRYKLVVDVY